MSGIVVNCPTCSTRIITTEEEAKETMARATPPGTERVPEGTMEALERISSQVAACALAVDEDELIAMLENCGKLADTILTRHRATQKDIPNG